jgi:glycerol-3-phosphate dehydrogenase
MNVTLALTAALYGATVVNHAEVNELVKDPATGKITGVKIKDLLQEGRADDGFYVKAKVRASHQPPILD